VTEAPHLEVFADITCPFAHVGLRRLLTRRRELGREDLRLWVRAWPLELVNGEPLAADAVAHKVDQLRVQVAPDLFTGLDPATFPATSLPALGLVERAYEVDVAVGEQASLLLRDALFEEGRDIAEVEVIDDVARHLGMPTGRRDGFDRVVTDWHEGQRRGVLGSPHFFVGGQGWFCPALDISHVDGELRVEHDLERFEHFVDACFGA
jgi:predicted DsbA family dithiol-disulfide isomerase